MKEIFIVFIGSGLGGLSRFAIAKYMNPLQSLLFPYGTFTINALACFVLGFVVGLADTKHAISAEARLFFVVGFCGGFSTFSTFSYELLIIFQKGNYLLAFTYIFLSVTLCLFFTFLGLTLANNL